MQNIVRFPHCYPATPCKKPIETLILSLASFNVLVKEAGRLPPPFPFIFFKPVTCIIGHDENVVVPKIAQDDQADYEGELVSTSPPSTSGVPISS
jgi:2-keto-4-pentenoate hydratase/2-oxohepta-3-ene-1,7-dioic acid hydratase in catechol pathway